jgi:hypothetical protein
MNIYKREFCVLCHEKQRLLTINTINIPVNPLRILEEENVNFYNLQYGYCDKCYSVQIMTLLDPNLLYGNNYALPNPKCYNWIQHNIGFVNFIVSSLKPSVPIIEIGSSSFVIGKHLLHYYPNYTVFDYTIKDAVKIDQVKYIEGNCEEYNYPLNSNIIMSHVFEHLYNPKIFLSNCKKNNVENIIISVPSMNELNELFVFNQHTFLYNDTDIEYIFGNYGYKSITKKFFNTNDNSFPCLFLHFKLTNTNNNIERQITLNRHLFTKNILTTLTIPNKTIIATAGMHATIVFSIIENKENILEIIDSNTNIHGKYFCNSKHIVKPYEILKKYKSDTSILVFGYRKSDIINMIKEINDSIKIIILY